MSGGGSRHIRVEVTGQFNFRRISRVDTSLRFKGMLDESDLKQSMSRVGRCIVDNESMKSFWGTLKCEKYYLHTYKTFEQLQGDIDDYIHLYNYERLQKKLNGLSPMEFRTKAA
ncbi:IS3 family transposase [Paenibacillus glycanilyticus]|uniref:IS3 family transposase n=1 Tax=Paenibacillus glycanilyticus TaxID=126569 RepID=UPI0037CC880B